MTCVTVLKVLLAMKNLRTMKDQPLSKRLEKEITLTHQQH